MTTSTSVSKTAAKPVSDDILRVGVIGLGIGQYIMRQFAEHPRVKLAALADISAERLQKVGDAEGIAARYTDALAMLKEESLDIVYIATPNRLHKPLTLAALAAGCDVVCEKPLAMNAAEAQEMVKAADEAGLRLMVNFNKRFLPAPYALKRAIEAGECGPIYSGRAVWNRRRGLPGFGGWFGQKAQSGGGPLIDLGVHMLDIALWLMGYPTPVWVMGNTYDQIAAPLAAASEYLFDVEDLATAMIRFDNGASLVLEASWASHIGIANQMYLQLLGSQGGVELRNDGVKHQFESARLFTERHGSLVDELLTPSQPQPASSMHHLVDCMREGIPHTADGREGLTVMKLLDAIYASAQQGRPVEIT